MKINKIISGVFSLLILSSFIGCTEIEDHPDGRTDYSDLFTTNRKTYTYMNQCYGWILNYGMNYNYTMLAGCTDEAKDSWELQNGVTRKWNEGQLSPFSNPLEGIEGNPENYNYYYQGIRACNIFLANIPTASVYSEDIRNSFKAQVLTLRAFYYLQLVKRYGGVPIITTPDYDYTKVKRGTFGECARQILADCQAAIDIPTVEEWGWRSLDKENYRHVMTKAICAASVHRYHSMQPVLCTMTEQSLGQKPQKLLKSLWMTVWRTIMNFIRNSRMLQQVILLMMCISIRALTCR